MQSLRSKNTGLAQSRRLSCAASYLPSSKAQAHARAGTGNVLRRNRRRPLRQRTRPAGRRAVQSDRPPSRLRRRRARAGLARPRQAHAAADPPGARRVRLHAGGYRRDRLYRRSRPGRRPAGGGFLCPGGGLRLGRAGGRRAPHGRAPAGADAGRAATAVPVRRLAGFRRSHPVGAGGRHRSLPVAWRIGGRCRRRSLRQDRQADRPGLSRRSGNRPPGGARHSWPLRVPAAR